ncbi:hypothetical protein RE943_07180 [Prescottella equi]|uniref:DUF222 domain-containing protein n=1 Tax=Rhodococcus hoagii TaxID=43767 RepID=UPI001C76C776|nr:DUF222 domain-containing protein [Prescottella equi]BCN67245.1 hypothetical protein RE943_07180 [Prescottella equi]
MFDSVATGETVDADASAALAEQHARIAREQFREIDWVTTLFVIRCEEDARAGRNDARHGEFAHVEVAGILGLAESAARRMIDLGCDLRWRLHQVRAEFQAGRIDLAKAHALSEALSNVSDDKLEDIERRLLDGAGRSTTSRLKERARRLIARLDPDGVRERRLRATDDRGENAKAIAGKNLSAEWPTVRDRPHERWCVPIPELSRGGRHLRPRPHDSVRPRSPRAGRAHHRIESCLPVSDPSPTRDARLLVRPSDR